MLPAFALARPTSVDEAVALLSEERVPLCGGTELLLAMRAGLHRPEALVDLKRVPGLDRIGLDGDDLVIGGTARHIDVAAHPDVRRHVPVLVSVETHVGNARVRVQGSVGGNLCFAEPKSDLATILVGLGASVELRGPSGVRTVTVADFVQGAYWADREPDELLTAVRVPVVEGRRCAYRKFQITERPTVGVAVVEAPDGGVAVVVGAAGEVPVRRDFPDLGSVDAAAVAGDVDYVGDVTGSERYKRHVTEVVVRRTVADLTGSKSAESSAGPEEGT